MGPTTYLRHVASTHGKKTLKKLILIKMWGKKPDLTAAPHYEACHSGPTSSVDRACSCRDYLSQGKRYTNTGITYARIGRACKHFMEVYQKTVTVSAHSGTKYDGQSLWELFVIRIYPV